MPQRTKLTPRAIDHSFERDANLNVPSNNEALNNQTPSTTNTHEVAAAKKQRPSKRARQRMRKKLEKLQLEEKRQQENNTTSLESGHEMAWDNSISAPPTTSTHFPMEALTSKTRTDKDKQEEVNSPAVSAVEGTTFFNILHLV